MFTGIIEETGKIKTVTQNKITVEANVVTKETKQGDSIAVNGVCLTVTNIGANFFDADMSPETLKVTTLGNLRAGSAVNLERAVQVGSRLGGHIVSGHVDGLGRVKYIKKERDFYNFAVELPSELSKYVVKKGSITVNGISLTVAEMNNNIVNIAVIPHTFENTALKSLQAGEYVNIETDILAKYVEKILSTSDNRAGISMEFLTQHGF